MTSETHWEEQASNWIRWVRGPVPDAYSDYAMRFFELLPPPGRRALEIGCGEGRVSRDLASRGYTVTGIDIAPTLIQSAHEADPVGDYQLVDAAALPFEDGEFDLWWPTTR